MIDYDDHRSNIIYGCRDHSIRSLVHNFQTGSTQEVQIFDHPHLDTGDICKTKYENYKFCSDGTGLPQWLHIFCFTRSFNYKMEE